jgi:hypothetical protein
MPESLFGRSQRSEAPSRSPRALDAAWKKPSLMVGLLLGTFAFRHMPAPLSPQLDTFWGVGYSNRSRFSH